MGEMQDFQFIAEDKGNDYLKISVNNRGSQITGKISAVRYIDADTAQYVIVMPGVGITSYGSSIKKADEMLKEALSDYFSYLMSLSTKKRNQELLNNGWRRDPLSTKVFSKLYVDSNGELCANAKDNKVERLAIIA
jgi:hypothetical protein